MLSEVVEKLDVRFGGEFSGNSQLYISSRNELSA
jgi:hypothetical protein